MSRKNWLAAIALLKESREAIAACLRVISQTSSDPKIIARLEFELKQAGVSDRIGVRLQDFIAAMKTPQPRKAGKDRLERLARPVGRYLSAWFWFPIYTAHWKMWRLSIAQLRATRCRFRELGLSLECQGDEQCKQIARDIRKILESKY